MEKQEPIGRYRKLGKIPYAIFLIFMVLGVALAVFYIFGFSIFGETLLNISFRFLIIAIFLPFSFLLLPARKGQYERILWYDWAGCFLSFAIPFYFYLKSWDVVFLGWPERVWGLNIVAAIILCLLVLEMGRRTGGIIYFLICIICGIYPLLAGNMPGILRGKSYNLLDTVSFYTFGTESGLVGLPTAVMGDILIGFLLFAAVLLSSGAGTFFLDIAFALFGRFRGGPAKVAVVGSGFFGSMSGSAVANVVGTGSFTIPAMKKVGFHPEYAGAVEACASTGGIFMPPVMGSVAFVMTEFLAISYADVILAAALPAILYYLALLIQVDAYAARTGMKGMKKEDLPPLKATMKKGWHFIIAFIFLVWGLLHMRWEALTPYYATALLILLSMVRKETRLNWKRTVAMIEQIGRLLVDIVAVLLPIAFIIASLVNTGLAPAFTTSIVEVGGSSPYLILLFGVVICYFLGMMGMITPAYIFLAVSMAPALVKLGFNTLAVHLFIVYYSMLACISPPVAVASFVGANIAGAHPMKTAYRSMKMGFVLYLLPFFFVFNPALILQGPLSEIIQVTITSLVGVFLMAEGFEGYFLGIGKLGGVSRFLLVLSGFFLAIPERYTDYIGLGMAVLVLGILYFKKRALARQIAPSETPEAESRPALS